ncbi:MAG: hypothetical protein Q9225_001528 [Loekoesia sp. 1 TL-2023]
MGKRLGKRKAEEDNDGTSQDDRFNKKAQIKAAKEELAALQAQHRELVDSLGLSPPPDDDDDTTAGPSNDTTQSDEPDAPDSPPAAAPSTFQPTEDAPDSPPPEGYPPSPPGSGSPSPPHSPAKQDGSAPAKAAAAPSATARLSRPTQPTIAANFGNAGWPIAHTALAAAEPVVRQPPGHVWMLDQTLYAQRVNRLLTWAYANPGRWNTLLGLYFQRGERSPKEVDRNWDWASGLNGFRRNWRAVDLYVASGRRDLPFSVPSGDTDLQILYQGSQNERELFEEGVSRWARDQTNFATMENILRAAFFTNEWERNDDWHAMDNILKMHEGEEKQAKMAKAKKESPLFFAACLDDPFCGERNETVHQTLSNGQKVEDTFRIRHLATGPLRTLMRRDIFSKHPKLAEDTMNTYSANGRPTQFHAVPPEERAYDENGNQLPWALEWPDDHPNARGQKKRPIETGPFGKSMRRKGSSRATRTATPAKKESSAVDGFLRGLEEDKRRAELYNEGRDSIVSSTTLQQDSKTANVGKEPVQVMLYGFSPSTQWAAIAHYEKASGGMICEDYDRHPPSEARRIPTSFSSPGMVPRHALTPTEKKLSMSYKGGKAWIRVTFDSAEAAERACYNSPRIIQGHWVYAEMYADGIIPNGDEPIPCRPEDREAGLTTPVKPSHIPSHKMTQSLGPASTRNMQSQQRQTSATLPRSFTSNTTPHTSTSQRPEAESESPSTASSATATAPNTNAGSLTLHQRRSELQGQPSSGNAASLPPQQGNTQNMRFFPDVPRTVLRPASEAFLPQPTFTQRTLSYLENLGLIPGDVIGNLVPLTESGEFDWANASFYWRFFYWLDTTFGSDLCGLKDD